MSGINKVILIGRLGQDPDVKHLQSGDAIANVSLATSETWKDKNSGERQERTEWHRVSFFGGVAEVVQKYLRKGSNIYVEGKLRTRKWQDKDGNDRYTTEVVVDMRGTMQMLDGKKDADFGHGSDAEHAPRAAQEGRGADAAGRGMHGQGKAGERRPEPAGDFDDDIPF
jgi:single-strand DNA-binding protein